MKQCINNSIVESERGREKEKRTRHWRALSLLYNLYYRLLVECLSYVNGASYCATYHRVVTDTEEAHHLYVSGH